MRGGQAIWNSGLGTRSERDVIESVAIQISTFARSQHVRKDFASHAPEIDKAVSGYLGKLPAVEQAQIISLDGKTARGTITAKDRFGVHLLLRLPARSGDSFEAVTR